MFKFNDWSFRLKKLVISHPGVIMGTSTSILLAFGSHQCKKYTPAEIGPLSKFHNELFKLTDDTSD